MADSPLGRTLVIANPTAHSGSGERGADFVERFFASYKSATSAFELRRTKAAGDATRMAAAAQGFSTVVALGGDGVIHEVVNGLMKLPRADRPQLGIVPLGSGNDYARTLGMAKNDAEAALAQLVRSAPREVELGRVNGQYFMQTLSFGLDAAIALDTTDRRAAGTQAKGEALFTSSAVKVFSQAKEGWACTASFNNETPLDLTTLIFAVQVGPTYGGGFAICPDADPTDGELDVCYNVSTPCLPHLMGLLGLARFGRHTGSKVVRLRRIARARIDFVREPPAQADGEKLRGTHFEIEVAPKALRVLFPA